MHEDCCSFCILSYSVSSKLFDYLFKTLISVWIISYFNYTVFLLQSSDFYRRFHERSGICSCWYCIFHKNGNNWCNMWFSCWRIGWSNISCLFIIFSQVIKFSKEITTFFLKYLYGLLRFNSFSFRAQRILEIFFILLI